MAGSKKKEINRRREEGTQLKGLGRGESTADLWAPCAGSKLWDSAGERFKKKAVAKKHSGGGVVR